MALGVLGGTFDPIHLGHLIIGEEVRLYLGLEEVVFIPTGSPWMKQGKVITPGEHRLAMTRLAVACNPFFRVSSIEIDRPGATYTVDTLSELNEERPGSEDIYFILGMDSLATFPRWKDPDAILSLCKLAVVSRAGVEDHGLEELARKVPASVGRVVPVPAPVLEISGTCIRERASRGQSIRYLVPEAVERYIRSHGLYLKQGGSSGRGA